MRAKRASRKYLILVQLWGSVRQPASCQWTLFQRRSFGHALPLGRTNVAADCCGYAWFLWLCIIVTSHYYDFPLFRPSITVASHYCGRPSLCPPTIVADHNCALRSLWPTIIVPSHHCGRRPLRAVTLGRKSEFSSEIEIWKNIWWHRGLRVCGHIGVHLPGLELQTFGFRVRRATH